MENLELRSQVRDIMNRLITYRFSQIFDIAPEEKQLQDLYEAHHNALEPIIGLLFTAIMTGKRDNALTISDKVWNTGGEISTFFELIYTDCLLNIGAYEKAGILLKDRLSNIAGNLPYFYMVMVKYALLTGKMIILKELSEYNDVYASETNLFDFAEKYISGIALKNYQTFVRIVYENIKDYLCAFEYISQPQAQLKLVFYTSLDTEQTITKQKQIVNKLNGYFASIQVSMPQDLTVSLNNIKLHPAWVRTDI